MVDGNYIAMCHFHDDAIKWKHFPRNWPFVWGIHGSPVNSPHKRQWREALMFSLICTWTSGWVNNGKAGDLRRHCDVTVMGCWNRNIPVHIDQYHGWWYPASATTVLTRHYERILLISLPPVKGYTACAIGISRNYRKYKCILFLNMHSARQWLIQAMVFEDIGILTRLFCNHIITVFRFMLIMFPLWRRHQMETFSALLAGHLCGEFTKTSNAELWCFLWSAPE